MSSPDPNYMARFRLGKGMSIILDGTRLLVQMAIRDAEQQNEDRPPGDVQLMTLVMAVQKVGDQAILEVASSSPDKALTMRMLERAVEQLQISIDEESEHGKH